MRTRLVSLILFGCAYVVGVHAESDALQSKVDAYLDKVGPILAQALMPELAKHPELGNVKKTFSFRINAAGHPSKIKATSVPSTTFLDQLVVRVIRRLKFPPIPNELLQKYPEIEFRTEMGPPDH